MNSKRKGKRGELDAAHAIYEYLGIRARRGIQYAGTPDSPDVVADLPHVHWEVKRVERLNVPEALEQAIRQAADYQVPVLLHRQNRRPWLVTVRLSDLRRLVEKIAKAINDPQNQGASQ
jgi:hypothetical protein